MCINFSELNTESTNLTIIIHKQIKNKKKKKNDLQHPSIRENVTIVRRDINEEHVLVSYFVPHSDVFEIADIRNHLKTKLPSYAVPSSRKKEQKEKKLEKEIVVTTNVLSHQCSKSFEKFNSVAKLLLRQN